MLAKCFEGDGVVKLVLRVSVIMQSGQIRRLERIAFWVGVIVLSARGEVVRKEPNIHQDREPMKDGMINILQPRNDIQQVVYRPSSVFVYGANWVLEWL